MKTPILLLLLALLPSCENLTPEERALLLKATDRAVTIGLDRLEPKPVHVNAQK